MRVKWCESERWGTHSSHIWAKSTSSSFAFVHSSLLATPTLSLNLLHALFSLPKICSSLFFSSLSQPLQKWIAYGQPSSTPSSLSVFIFFLSFPPALFFDPTAIFISPALCFLCQNSFLDVPLKFQLTFLLFVHYLQISPPISPVPLLPIHLANLYPNHHHGELVTYFAMRLNMQLVVVPYSFKKSKKNYSSGWPAKRGLQKDFVIFHIQNFIQKISCIRKNRRR